MQKISKPYENREAVTKLDDSVLLDDHRWMHVYWANLKRGVKYENWTEELVRKTHAWIVHEMLSRFLFPSMSLELDQIPETIKVAREWLEKDVMGIIGAAEPNDLIRTEDFIENVHQHTEIPKGILIALWDVIETELNNQGLPGGPNPPWGQEKQQGGNQGGGAGSGAVGRQRTSYNSPTLAYIAVYGKEPDPPLRGRIDTPEKEWKNGIMIDEHLKFEWLENIEKIEELEIRASCEGHGEDRVSYVVIRLLSRDKNDSEKLTEALSRKKNIYAKYDVGTEGHPRIAVAGKTWYGQPGWEDWWEGLAGKIKSAVEESVLKSLLVGEYDEDYSNKAKAVDEDDLAPVHSSGIEIGRELKLENVISDFNEDFIIDPSFLRLGGNILSGESASAVDIHVNGNFDGSFKVPLEFRLGRASSIAEKLQYHYHSEELDKEAYEPFYALVARRINAEHQVVAMSLNSDTNYLSKELGEIGSQVNDVLKTSESVLIKGESVTKQQVLDEAKTIVLRTPFIFLIGGIVNRRATKGDVDVLIRGIFEDEFRGKISGPLRSMSSTPKRVHILQDYFHGPFTSHIPLYELALVPVHKMKLKDAQKQRAAPPELKREAERSKNEDEIEMFRFFITMKPTKGAQPEQRQSLENFLALFSEEDYPIINQKKYDGLNSIIWKSGKRVEIYSEDGNENTDRYPQTVEAIRKLNADKLCLLAEVELWEGEHHLPREAVVGYTNSISEPDDSSIVFNFYDVVYVGGLEGSEEKELPSGDIHKEPYEIRYKVLQEIDFGQETNDAPDLDIRLNRSPIIICKNEKELRETTIELTQFPGSEGVVAKPAKGTYVLHGRRGQQVKFHVSAVCNALVVKRNLVSGTKAVYYYDFGFRISGEEIPDKKRKIINGKTYLVSGRTFNTSLFAKQGEVLEVEFEQANHIIDKDKGEEDLTLWALRVMRKVDARSDSFQEILKKAEKENVLVAKEIENKEIMYKSFDEIETESIIKSLSKELEIEWVDECKDQSEDGDDFDKSAFYDEVSKSASALGDFISIDLCSGAGGLSLGLEKAGFSSAILSDLDDDSMSTVERNFKGAVAWKADLQKLDFRKLRRALKGRRLSILSAGLPCQGYSIRGHFTEAHAEGKERHSSLNRLYKYFLRGVGILKPDFILIENVPAILTRDDGVYAKLIMRGLKKLGYYVEYEILKAEEYGVPQSRRRIFFIGNRIGLPVIYPQSSSKRVTAWEAISDLSRKSTDVELGHLITEHSEEVKHRISQVKPGGRLLSESGSEGFTRIRIHKNKPSNTVTTSPNLIHPTLHRVLTPREYARIQSFPDSFRFCGGAGSQYRQIGNAVPVLLAKAIGKVIIKQLKDRSDKKKILKDFEKQFEQDEFSKSQLFGSPGGKSNIVKKIIKLFPEHKTYTEVFAGGLAIFFKKTPSEIEVINDFDSEIAFAYRFAQKYTEADLEELKKFNWISSRKRWFQVHRGEIKPKSDAERFALFMYYIRGSFSSSRVTYAPSREGQPVVMLSRLLKNLESAKERLKGVKIYSSDYEKVLKEYDSAGTLHYVDPPYPGEWQTMRPNDEKIDLGNLKKILNEIKGKFILSLDINEDTTQLFKDFYVKKILRLTMFSEAHRYEDNKRPKEFEYLISNFDLNNNNKKSLLLKEFDFEKQQNPFMVYPDENETYKFVVQHHARGKSIHGDLRMESERKEFLIGFTLNDQIKGAIKEPVETLAQLKEIDADDDNFKINWTDGTWDQRIRAGQEKPTNVNINCQKKVIEPHEWLEYEGKVEAAPEEEEVAPGATRFYPGVFHIVDEGTVEYGMNKSYAHEYFFHGKAFNYRIIIRQLKLPTGSDLPKSLLIPDDFILGDSLITSESDVINEKAILPPADPIEQHAPGPLWLAIKPIDQTPYVITKEAVDKKWMPPNGVSALPKYIREQIPDRFQYWKKTTKDTALKLRDELVEAIKQDEVAVEVAPDVVKAEKATGDFTFSYQWFKGPTVVREGPSKELWHIFMDYGGAKAEHIQFMTDPLTSESVSGTLKSGIDKKAMKLEGFLEPGGILNPTKETPSWIKIRDTGKVTKMVDKPTFKKYEFKGKQLKGLFTLEAEAEGSEIWVFSPSELPAVK